LLTPPPQSSLCDHRPLPSFPTRRSSDLIGAAHAPVRQQCAQTPTADEVRRCIAESSAVHGRGKRVSIQPGAAPTISSVAQRRQVDRKSTRLNSSHVKISYAVFCLKKKQS